MYEAILHSGNLVLYRLFVMLGGLAGIALFAFDSRGWAVTPRQRIAIVAATIGGGLLGAAIPAFVAGGFVASQAFTGAVGPKSILGGLAGGFGAVAVYKRFAGLLHVETADSFARGTPLMMAIGRIGCWFGHCCFGIASPPGWPGADLGDGIPRVPVQLLESIAMFGLFGVMCVLHARGSFRDRRLFVFFVLYGIARFSLEFLREPIAATTLGLGAYQWFALALAAIGVFQVSRRSIARSAVGLPRP